MQIEEKHLKAAGVKDPAKWLEAVQKTCDEFEINTPQRIASFIAQTAHESGGYTMITDRLVIREDHVLEAMLRQLGATVTHAREPFRPEGGAYGHGRTMGHGHGHSHHGAVHFHGSHRHDDDATPPDEAE